VLGQGIGFSVPFRAQITQHWGSAEIPPPLKSLQGSLGMLVANSRDKRFRISCYALKSGVLGARPGDAASFKLAKDTLHQPFLDLSIPVSHSSDV